MPADWDDIYNASLRLLLIGSLFMEHERTAIETVILLRELQDKRNNERKDRD